MVRLHRVIESQLTDIAYIDRYCTLDLIEVMFVRIQNFLQRIKTLVLIRKLCSLFRQYSVQYKRIVQGHSEEEFCSQTTDSESIGDDILEAPASTDLICLR